ncbi:MAG TPA: Yip1 family protein [Blastocatellia bacterium]|nr:Yip1 family protein [Blastocatellia bacterium]
MSQPEDGIRVGTPPPDGRSEPEEWAHSRREESAPNVPAEPAQIGPAGRFVGVILSPTATFADINRKPTWLIPMIIAIVLGIGFFTFYNWRVKPDWREIARQQVEKRAERPGATELTEEQKNAQIEVATKFMSYTPIIAPVAVVVFVPIVYLFVAGVLALGSLLFQAKATFKKILSIYAWTSCSVGVVSAIVNTAILMTKDRDTLKGLNPSNFGELVATNLGAILQPASPFIKSFTQSLDIFSFWSIILVSVGLAAVGGTKKFTKGKAATLVVLAWLCYVLIKSAAASIGIGG